MGSLTGATQSVGGSALVKLHQLRDPNFQPSLPIPELKRASGGTAAYMGSLANCRYQIVSGIDRQAPCILAHTSSSLENYLAIFCCKHPQRESNLAMERAGMYLYCWGLMTATLSQSIITRFMRDRKYAFFSSIKGYGSLYLRQNNTGLSKDCNVQAIVRSHEASSLIPGSQFNTSSGQSGFCSQVEGFRNRSSHHRTLTQINSIKGMGCWQCLILNFRSNELQFYSGQLQIQTAIGLVLYMKKINAWIRCILHRHQIEMPVQMRLLLSVCLHRDLS